MKNAADPDELPVFNFEHKYTNAEISDENQDMPIEDWYRQDGLDDLLIEAITMIRQGEREEMEIVNKSKTRIERYMAISTRLGYENSNKLFDTILSDYTSGNYLNILNNFITSMNKYSNGLPPAQKIRFLKNPSLKFIFMWLRANSKKLEEAGIIVTALKALGGGKRTMRRNKRKTIRRRK